MYKSFQFKFILIAFLAITLCVNCGCNSKDTSQLDQPSSPDNGNDGNNDNDDNDDDSDDDNDNDNDDNNDGNGDTINTGDIESIGFSWDKVHFINGGVIVNQDISDWSETSHIESFSMSSNGICIDHTMKNTWVTIIHPGYLEEPSEVQGSPWIFIPMDDGKIYAKRYEHLRSKNDPAMGGQGGQVCKLGVGKNTLAEVISNLVDHVKSIHLTGKPQRDAIEPIKDWYPQPDDIVGFAVSTYGGTPGDYRSGSINERSDIVWVKIPDYNTVDSGGEIVGRSSNRSSSSTTTTTTTTNSGS